MDNNVKPVKFYLNVDINKDLIYKENKKKAGIYRWVNLVTNKSYIGSSSNIASRLKVYYSFKTMRNKIDKESSIIYRAILKYGYSKFKLDILEYCEVSSLISREQHYIDLLKPEYNILKMAGNRLGHKLGLKTKIKLSFIMRGRKLETPNILKKEIKVKTYTFTEETRLKLSLRTKGIAVKVSDSSGNLIKEFPSIKSAARYFKIGQNTIRNVFYRGVAYDGYTYEFKIKDLRIWVYNSKHELIKVFNTIKETSLTYNIPSTTLQRYVKSNNLYNNQFYFYNNINNPNLNHKETNFK